MKKIICIGLLCCLVSTLSAQVDTLKKPSTLAFHAFYNDFTTAQAIRTTSLKNVIDKKLGTNIGGMQMGFGFSYLKGISDHIDFVSDLDGSATDYLFKDGSIYGNNKFLLDVNAGVNLKLLTDRHAVDPYLFTGAGFSLYQGKSGVYIPVGAGLQFNLFNQAFVFTNMQYRRALGINVNDHFQYSIGIAASFGKKPKAIAPPVVIIPVTKPDTLVIAKIQVKNITVSVTDAQTGLPLPEVAVTLNGPDVNIKTFSAGNGRVTFNTMRAGDYTISGTLNDMATTIVHIAKSDFDIVGDTIRIGVTHNDPRFTLTGIVINKSTGKSESGVTVSISNITQNSSTDIQSKPGDGSFNVQISAGSDFTISGKKAAYISNIEKVSTVGLNRSTTLYVKLELGIEEALPGKTIALSDIYYDTGSYEIKAAASPDLEKLVKFLKDNLDLKVEISSYTDSRGSAKRNMILSQARARQVVNYLQQNGISKNRLIPKGYGETRLLNGCTKGVKCTEAQHAQNRRTEFKVIDNS